MAKKQRPSPAEIQEALQQAHILVNGGHLTEAEQIYREVLKLSSTNVDALHGLAQLRYQQQRYADALALYDRLRVMLPRHPAVLIDRGNTLKRLDRTAEALTDYDKALALSPDNVHALYNRGNALLALGRQTDALASFDRALIAQPDLFQAQANRGNALLALGRMSEALESYEKGLAGRPGDVEILNNVGTALSNLGRDAESIAFLSQALAKVPDFPNAHFSKALALLRQGNFKDGWQEYEWRWGTPYFVPQQRNFTAPLWLGAEPLTGRTILLHAEQGYGDTIQFIRYAPQVAALGARLIVEVPKELMKLVGGMATMPADAAVIASGTALPPFDLHCPLMSLPLAFATLVTTIPAQVPYMTAPDIEAERWRERLATVDGPRVGLVWAGRPTHSNDVLRSLRLSSLLPLLEQENLRFICLQKELRPEDKATLAAHSKFIAVGDSLHSFADTAAAIAALDLVITVDTSVAHLAGAMGKPVWILLPYAPDFRWLTERSDSPWYPTARLFRQTKAGDWPSVIAQVAAELGRADLFPAA